MGISREGSVCGGGTITAELAFPAVSALISGWASSSIGHTDRRRLAGIPLARAISASALAAFLFPLLNEFTASAMLILREFSFSISERVMAVSVPFERGNALWVAVALRGLLCSSVWLASPPSVCFCGLKDPADGGCRLVWSLPASFCVWMPLIMELRTCADASGEMDGT